MLEALVIPDEENPLLRRINSGFTFANDPDRELAAARYFAAEINYGRLSVREAYVNFWSYEEDTELWGLPADREWRALLPAWQPVLLQMTEMLEPERAKEFVSTASQSYISSQESLKDTSYQPFFADLCFVSKFIESSVLTQEDCEGTVKLFEGVIDSNYTHYGGAVYALRGIAGEDLRTRYESPEDQTQILGVCEVAIAMGELDTGLSVTYWGAELNRDTKTELLLECFSKSNYFATAILLGYSGDKRAVGPLLGRLHDQDKNMRQAVIWALGKLGDSKDVIEKLRLADDHSSYSSIPSLIGQIHQRLKPKGYKAA